MILDYRDIETLVENDYYSLHKVECKETGNPFLLKKFYHINDQGIASLKSGVKLAKELKLDIILEPIEVIQLGQQTGVLYQNFDCISLRSYLKEHKKLCPEHFLEIARHITKVLTEFQSRGWILRNCNPDTFLLHTESHYFKIGDLRRATRVHKQEPPDTYSSAQPSELHYISPEQTGRTSQITDHRSDYYSLGIIFYEMLTGEVPFRSTNPIEIIHSHLALTIASPKSVDVTIPAVLDSIVSKLLAKSSEERYQSSEGLLHDLEIAHSFFGSNKAFKPGLKDKVIKILPTSQLIGRKIELEAIEYAYSLSKTGKKQTVLISGYSGVGKTRIVEEFYHNKLTDNVPMIVSKFDILQRNSPYSALLNAISGLVTKLLKEDDDTIEYWRARLKNSLQDNAAIMIEVIPEFEAIMGFQSKVDDLPPDETQRRFQQTFLNFFKTFTTDTHTLILFLDDLQWADIASIRFMELLLMTESIKNFLFIGAYRDNEVDPTHPLAITIKKIEQWTNIRDIHISTFTEQETNELIAKTLHDPIAKEKKLSEILYQKSGGNTFFILQLLTALFEEHKLIRNDDGVWEFDENAIMQESASENVIEFLVKKIKNLEPELQSLLKIAACIADVFDLRILSLLANKKMNSVANTLSVAINSGYLISLDEKVDAFFKMISNVEETELSTFDNTRFKFAHDRIRQACLVLVASEELELLNLKAARIKVETMIEQQLEEESFVMAHHYNSCEKLIDNKEERDLLVYYNYRSGLKAKSASAYQSAIDYFNSAKSHVSFEDAYAIMYDIYLHQAECLYLNGQYDEAEAALDILYGACKTNLDRLNTLFTKVYLYNIQDKKLEALEAGRIGYALYGIKIPSKKAVIMFLLLKDILKAKFLLPERKIPSMLERPLMKDDERIRFQEFLLAMAPTIYQYDQKLFGWNIMRMFFATLKYGNNGISSFCYIGYGMMISQLFGKYTMGKKLADLAMDLNNKLGYTALKWKVRLSYFNFVHHWTEPVRPDLDTVLEVENGAYANGDPIFAGYAIFVYLHSKFVLGFKLEEVLSSYENYLDVTEKRKDAETQHFLECYYYAIRCLIGIDEDTLVMGADYNAPERIREAISLMNFSVVADIHVAYMQTLFMFGHFQEALEVYLNASKHIDFVQQRYEFAEYNFYAILICSAAFRDNVSTDKNLNKLAKKHLKNLKTWSELCPDNFEPQYLLAAAEFATMNKKSNLFNQFYEKAILSAESYGFINYKALAGELAGRKQYALGNRIMAETYLKTARKDYHQWGALAKVKNLEQDFKDIFKDSLLIEQNKKSQHNLVGGMDLSLIIQATQAVKSAKDIDGLVEQLMKVIIQYSGADKGSLLVKNRTELIVKAQYTSNGGIETVPEEADSEHLPMNIVKYVMRVKTHLILNQPALIPEYSATKYFTTHSPKSVICYPILKQGVIFGVLYLENYSQVGIFDERKVNMLNIISSQVAISLDNAYLYDSLETQIMERTQAITAEKGVVDEMLENILPKASIAELKRTGKTTAQKFEGVTVLMADIKGFTKISERLTPEELISKIDFYFSAFDAIMQKYHLEKIKTIGDAYMAAGGLQGNTQEAANNMVKAAIEMQQCIYEENKNSVEEEKLEMRIGIHTGPVIAGVVGLKRFQYDIWGDTVNVAARMEQQSHPGRINVSKETYNLTNGFFELTYRGKIEGKNKGLMDMYFVESNKMINENPSAE